MKIRIPFTQTVLVIQTEKTLDAVLLSIITNRYLNYESKLSINRIDAIRHYRRVTGCGLMDAKDYVDALVRKNNIP